MGSSAGATADPAPWATRATWVTWAPQGVAGAVGAVQSAFDDLAVARDDLARDGAARRNASGGDPGLHRNPSTVVRHAVLHLVAARAAGAALAAGTGGPLLDVGGGTGAFTHLLADRLGRRAHLVEVDEGHRRVAARAARAAATGGAAHRGLRVRPDLAGAPAAAVVAAMEVVEHVPADAQVALVAAMAARVVVGGVLVLSTPDESAAPGGWSGYAPHTGPLDAAGLRRVVAAGTGEGWRVRVGRVDGPAFTTTRAGALVGHAANRAWGAAVRAWPPVEALATGAVHAATRHRRPAAVPAEGSWTVREATGTDWRAGTGLVALARRA